MTENEFKLLFGKNIKKFRLLKGFSQQKTAKEVGIASTNLSRIENGKDFVKASTILKLAKMLDVKPKDLFDFE